MFAEKRVTKLAERTLKRNPMTMQSREAGEVKLRNRFTLVVRCGKCDADAVFKDEFVNRLKQLMSRAGIDPMHSGSSVWWVP